MSWLFMILFAVVGGVIAYFADRLGRTLGKKRIRALGLRPRHTAEVMTVGAGVLIPVGTIFAVMLLSASAREWLFNSGRWKQEAVDFQRQADIARADFSRVREQLDSLNAKLPALERKFTDLTAQFKQKSDQLDQVGAKLKVATVRLSTESAQLNQTKGQLASVQGQLGQVRPLFAKVSADYGALKPKFADLNSKYGQLRQSYSELATQRDEANKEVVALNKQKDDLSGQLGNVKAEVVRVQAEVATEKQNLADTQAELSTTKEQLATAREDLQAAAFFANSYNRAFQDTRRSPVIFNVDDELARIAVPSGASQAQVRQIIGQLVKKAGVVAEERGAAGKSGEYCGLVPLPLSNGGSITIDQQEQACVNELAKTPNQPSVLIARALYNTVKGEFVPLLIAAMPNPLVYRKHQELAETWLRGGLDSESVYQQISTFLRTLVRDRAVKDNMIPIQGREDSLGEITPGDIIDLIQKYQKWGSGARLLALADTDTHAADPLRIHFDMQMR